MTKGIKEWMWYVIIGGVVGAVLFFISDDTGSDGITGLILWIVGFAVFGGVVYLITILGEKIGSVLTSLIVGAVVGVGLGIFFDLGEFFENETIGFIVVVAVCIVIAVGITLYRKGANWAGDKFEEGVDLAIDKADAAIKDKFGSPVSNMLGKLTVFNTGADMEYTISTFLANYPAKGWYCERQQNVLVFYTGVASLSEVDTTKDFYLFALLTFTETENGMTESEFLFRERNFPDEECPFETQMNALKNDVLNTYKGLDPKVKVFEERIN